MNVEKKHTLTQDQINEIFAFTTKKYVKYYDVQLELVDHVASKIEVLMMEDDSLTFESALQKVYKSYGIFGFTKIAEAKLFELNRMWEKRVSSFLYSYVSVQNIILLVLLTLSFYSIIRLLPSVEMYPLIWQWASIMITFMVLAIHRVSLSRKRKLLKDKTAIVDSYHMHSYLIILEPLGPILLLMFFPAFPYFNIVISAMIAFSVVWIYGMWYVFPDRLDEYILKRYCHLPFSN